MAEDHSNSILFNDLQVYLNCAAIAMFVLTSVTLLAVYGPYSQIDTEAIQGVGGKSGFMFVAPLVGALVVSGIQITSNRSRQSMPTVVEMVLFSTLHLIAFLASYLTVTVFQPLTDSMAVLMIASIFGLVLPAASFIHIRRKHSHFLTRSAKMGNNDPK
ncbi:MULTISPECIES: hypothetical protein [Marinobacter]|uniref:hypothetical protein n=1 Tax=Marinobacter TaxID=2742 RepID=UPI001248880A|nr:MULTISPECIES: hypothetical protein [Marinobacter]MBL3556405.1 hypothetical protein [Marinobacter sp. JB05H06]